MRKSQKIEAIFELRKARALISALVWKDTTVTVEELQDTLNALENIRKIMIEETQSDS